MTYIGKLELELDAQKHHERVTEALQGEKNPLRPYLFKDYGFHFEQEVRFVIRTNPKAHLSLIRIRAKDLITSFKFSDHIPDAERLCIERLAKQKLSEDVELSGHYSDADFPKPLSSANEPRGCFRTLTEDQELSF